MKTINSFRYILFALITLGCFANFAQNQYSLDMILWSSIGVAASYLVQSISEIFVFRKSSEKNLIEFLYSFFEKFSLLILFCIFIFRFHINPSLMQLMLLMAVQIIIPVLFWLKKSLSERQMIIPIYVNIFGLFIFSILPASYLFLFSSRSSFILFFIFYFFIIAVVSNWHYLFIGKKEFGSYWKYTFSTKYLKNFFMQIGIMPIFIYSIIVLYLVLGILHIAPELQSEKYPVAYMRFLRENKKAEAELFLKNYYQFLENRKKENQ